MDWLPGGIGLFSEDLPGIREIRVKADKVISIENLTSYHAYRPDSAMVLYLGGFPNTAQTNFLKKVFRFNPDVSYLHYGDTDVYGFQILRDLREKTGIPFQPLHTDVQTLQRQYESGMTRPLEKKERPLIDAMIQNPPPGMEDIRDVLEYMLRYDCKGEQESNIVLR